MNNRKVVKSFYTLLWFIIHDGKQTKQIQINNKKTQQQQTNNNKLRLEKNCERNNARFITASDHGAGVMEDKDLAVSSD